VGSRIQILVTLAHRTFHSGGESYLNLSYGIIVEKTVFVAYGQAQRLSDRFEVARNSNQRRMACISSVDLAVSFQNRVSSAPTEANGSDLSSSRNASNAFDERIDQRFRHSFPVLDQPRRQCRPNNRSSFRLIDQSKLLTSLEIWFH